MIKYNLSSIISIGYKPVAVVCDQGSNNRGAFNLLGVTKESPFFEILNQKVFALYDVPHLFKSVRNNWLTGTFKLPGKQFSFDVIRKVFDIDTKSATARALPKLTEKHVNPNNFEKMCCSLALQLFSNSVAAAIRSCVATGQIEEQVGSDTADFVSLLNNLFDALNSKSLYAKNPYNCSLSDKNPLIRVTLEKGKEMFDSLSKVSSVISKYSNKMEKKSRNSRPPCFEGIVQTINAVLMLFELEKTSNNEFILSSKLNQDYLENFFSIVRQKGGWNLNPTAKAFRLSFRIQSITNLLTPAQSSNCRNSITETDILLKSGQSKSHLKKSASLAVTFENGPVLDGVIDDSKVNNNFNQTLLNDKNSTVQLEDCAVWYYAGYLVKKTLSKFECPDCSAHLQNSNIMLDDPNQLLIISKNFGGLANNIHLKAPSDSTARMIKKSMLIFNRTFNDIKHQEFISMKMKSKIYSRNISWLGPKNHKCYEHKMFLISQMVNTNLFKFCKWAKNNKKRFTQKIKILRHN